MIKFLMSNPLFLIILVLVVMYLFVVLFLKVKKKKEKTTVKSQEQPAEEKISEVEEEKPILTLKEKKDGRSKKKLRKTKEKPSVQKVYERVETNKKENVEKTDTENLEEKEQEFLKDKQFVKTSKTVSKIVRVEQPVQEEYVEEVNLEDQPIIKIEEKTSRIRERVPRQKHGHFDRSKRLRRCVECNNFDDMFESHISEDYLNFDVDTHLRKTEIITDSLYKRASQTLANSSVKILGDEEAEHVQDIKSNKESMKAWIEEKRREELANIVSGQNAVQENEPEEDILADVRLDAKNILVVDSILNRKSITKHKKTK